jgi:ATP-dependent HslUV protease, peptidase subunit HslV
MVVVNEEYSLLITGQGDVVQPTDGIDRHRFGRGFCHAAARALVKHSELSASEIVRESLQIAAGIDIYTNDNIIVEELPCAN